MIKLAEMLPWEPTPLWALSRQAGVTHAVGYFRPEEALPDRPWELAPLRALKERFERAGLDLAVMECSPPMQKIRLGLPGRDEEIALFCTMLRNMGELGIPVLCYNFMAVFGWMRTATAIPARGGALVTGFSADALRGQPLTEYGEVPEARLWDNFEYFLHRVVPVAEKARVKLALHPDDPPLSPIRGIGRIMRTVEAFQRALDLVPSEYNGLTMCQGNFALMTDDLPGVIRHFGAQGKIFFIHFRDVRGTPEDFVETFHDLGQTDMLACMRAYQEIGFDGVLRPDHVPTLEGDANDDPCYSSIGRLLALGYITGLREAVYGRETPAGGGGMRLRGKVTIVTGAATGIGRAVALAFGREEAAVTVDHFGQGVAADEVAARVRDNGGTALVVEADVSDPAQVERLVRQTVQRFGGVDILVNNAAFQHKLPLLDTPLDLWDKTLATNLTGPWLCLQAAARQMAAQGGGGRIINLSSVHEDLAVPANIAYCAAKGGLRMLMRSAAVELAVHRIAVNNIAPGAIETPMTAHVHAQAGLHERLLAKIPLGRMGRPEEIAELALYLAAAPTSVTGQTFVIDGGLSQSG